MAMALRPIDNALPITPERPKKQAKVVVPVQKRNDSGVNDENKAPVPPSADAAVDYVSSEDLKPLTNPDSNVLLDSPSIRCFFLASDLIFLFSFFVLLEFC